jgi:branched-chain amino acid transport system permease protein
LGGLVIGLVDSVSGYLLTTGSKEAVYFVIFLLVLVVRPSGLMGLVSNLRGTGAKV